VLAGFLDFENFAAFVVAAFWAGTVRQLTLVAIGAFGKRTARQRIVSAPASGARLGVPPFWIWHVELPLFNY
jgi:hypothetical protein